MRKFAAFALPLLLVLALGAAGCGKADTTTSGNTVTLDASSFAQSSITISAGQAVTFEDPSSGVVHILCLGQHQTCNGSIKDGPPELSNPNSPITFNAGDTKSYTFPTKGNFDVTCTVHPGMDMVVHVQ
jgi:plastocyanin